MVVWIQVIVETRGYTGYGMQREATGSAHRREVGSEREENLRSLVGQVED